MNLAVAKYVIYKIEFFCQTNKEHIRCLINTMQYGKLHTYTVVLYYSIYYSIFVLCSSNTRHLQHSVFILFIFNSRHNES